MAGRRTTLERIAAKHLAKANELCAKAQSPFPDTFCGFCEYLGVRLTIGQRVLASITFDDVEPGDLEGDERALAAELFGPDVESVPRHCRTVNYWLKGARMGGTYMWALYLLYAGLTCSLTFVESDEKSERAEGLAPGEVAFGVIVAPEMKLAKQALRYTVGAAQDNRRINSMIVGHPGAESVTLRRDDGKLITIECRAASRGGKAARGFSYYAGLLDESCFFFDADSGVVNDTENYRAISARILPGGKLGVISTVWAERGLLWDETQANHNHPVGGLAAIAKTLTVRNTERNRTVYADELRRDPLNAAREFDCVPFDVGTGAFFDPKQIDAAVVPESLLKTINFGEHGGAPTALAIDTAFRRDATGGAIVRLDGRTITLAELTEIRPEPGKPLKPSEVVRQLVATGKAHECGVAVADQHYIETVREHIEDLRLIEVPSGNAGKMAMFLAAKTALAEGRVRIPEVHTELVKQLKDVVSKPLPGGGLQISSPRSKIGGHGDSASALVAGIWYLCSGGVPDDIAEQGLGGCSSDRYEDYDGWDDDD
jgi:hypothetical protein